MGTDRAIAAISHGREILLRTIAGQTVHELDFQLFPNSKTIGEILLHIAGFEFLVVAAAGWRAGERPGHFTAWRELKPGFGREAGFAPPRGRPLQAYLDRLAETRQRTLQFLRGADGGRGIAAAAFPIAALAEALAEQDDQDGPEHYRRLARGVSTSFADDGVPGADGRVDIGDLLSLHETYHRGQLTLSRYACSRATRQRS